MSFNRIVRNPALFDQEEISRGEEWNNFMHRVNDVSTLVKDMASGDKEKADAATLLANKYLDGKIINDEDVKMVIKSDRTVINTKAFATVDSNAAEIDKDSWMAAVSKDAEKRHQDKKVRRERSDTFKTQAEKAFRRQDYDKAVSCYNKAIEQIRDNPMLYCDRALTYIRLGKYDKVIPDCDLAIRLNEKSFKARLYKAKAYKEMEESDQYDECNKELAEMFPQHSDLIEYFLNKNYEKESEGDD